MIAVSQRQPMILEGESSGDIQKRACATGCPGVAASSLRLLFGQDGLLAPRQWPVGDREITDGN